MENHQVEAEQKLLAIIKHAPVGLAEIDENGVIIQLNTKGEHLLKPLFPELNATTPNLFPVLEQIAPGLLEIIKNSSFKTGILSANEVHHFVVSVNGRKIEKSYQFTVQRLYTDCIIISFDRVLKRKDKDDAIQQLEVDKAIEQDKFNFSANVLHDIGNAVVGLGSYANRINRSLEENNLEGLQNLSGFFEAQQTAIASVIGEAKAGAVSTLLSSIASGQKGKQDEIQKSVTELLKIITHIHEIIHIQRQYVSGNESHENKPTHIRGIINDCISMLFASFEKRGILLTLNVPLELPAIQCNRTRLMQVILNILKNSIEAIDITAKKKTISLNVFVHGSFLVLQIHDNGHGFDEITGAKLFDRGFTTKSSGTGLGLDNCRAIIESFNGTIDITSDGTGKGSLTNINFQV